MVLVLFTLALGCRDSVGPRPAESPPALATTTASPTATAENRSAVPPTAGPRPPGSPASLPSFVGLPSSARWQRWIPATSPPASSGTHTAFYDFDRDELWAVVGPNGEGYRFTLSPFGDRAVGTAHPPGDAETILLDLTSGAVTTLLRSRWDFRGWLSNDRVLLLPAVGGRFPTVYELDVGAGNGRPAPASPVPCKSISP
jgi:hypothetical protein